ncbi:MAG: arginine deiminase family protein [Spirochaetes bacterium]|nr:arginine deiminase family protein [Spirochaetota bacterium]
MNDRVSITSEIGKLEKIILHSPGFEVEEMTPRSASQVLYNDIIPLPVIAEDHNELKQILTKVAKVFEVEQLLSDVLANELIKHEFVDTIVRLMPHMKYRELELKDTPAKKLAQQIIIGIKEKKDTLTKFLSDNIFDLPPLPNLYFMRDSGIVVNSRVITGSMANQVRIMEAIIAKFIFNTHPQFKSDGFIFDGTIEGHPEEVTIEGGDLLVLKDDIIAIGISERTTTSAVDIICNRLAEQFEKPITVFAVVLPKERATIHLDMIFTMVDIDGCVIYQPYVTGKNILPVVEIKVDKKGKKQFNHMDNLLTGLKANGLHLNPILCGGNDPLHQEREQWLSGTNFFAFAPGKFIGYDCNIRTLEEISKAGYEVLNAMDVINGKKAIDDYKKCVIGIYGAELARGGGGVRCMTMPVFRQEVKW